MKIRTVMDDTVSKRGPASVQSDTLEVSIDTNEIARAIADAGRDVLSDAIRSNGPQASKGTIAQRKRKGISSERMFHATGRLANELEVVQNRDGSFDVVAPPGYLQDERLMEKFREHILNAALDSVLSDKTDEQIETETKDIVKVRRGGRGYFR